MAKTSSNGALIYSDISDSSSPDSVLISLHVPPSLPCISTYMLGRAKKPPKPPKPKDSEDSEDSEDYKLPANHYFDNRKVERLLIKYHETGCTDIPLRNEIMSHASELIINVIRTHDLHSLYGGHDESSFQDLFQLGYVQIESTLYKFKPGHAKVFNLWCCSPHEIVLSDNGIITIQEAIKKSENSSCSLYGLNGLSKITNHLHRPSTATLKIETDLGYELECTPEHRLYCLKSNGPVWSEAKDLENGDLLAIQYNQQLFVNDDGLSDIKTHDDQWAPPNQWTTELAYIMGLIVVKGSYSHDKLIIRNINRNVGQALANNSDFEFIYDHQLKQISLSNRKFIEFLHQLGFPRQIKHAIQFLPSRLLRTSKSIQESLIRGMSDEDGTYRLVSKPLVQQLRMLLLNLGFVSDLEGGNKSWLLHKNYLTLTNDNIAWLPIRTIQRSQCEVCEVTVDSPDHSYIVNGIVSHNSQVARTVMLAAIKKNSRDRKNVGSYREHLDERAIRRPVIFERFLTEARELCKYNTEHTAIVDALEQLYREDERPHEGLIEKLTQRSGLSRPRIIKFIKTLRLMSFEFTDSAIGEAEHQEPVIKPSQIPWTTDED